MDKSLSFEFPLDSDLLYLNHAAVSPWPKRTVEAIKSFAEENLRFGAQHYPDWIAKETQLRSQLKTLIGARSTDEIALLKNTSEAISVVAEGIQWQAEHNIVSSDQEFPSNRIPWLAQSQKHGVEFREVDLSSADSPEQALISACDTNTQILSISSVQYGTGLKLNLEKLGAYCQAHKILFCVDAIQSLGVYSIDVEACHIDFMMADAHKWLMGPEGIALFYCRQEVQELLELRQYGWHMVKNAGDYDEKNWCPAPSAKRFECGSPNMLGIHALSASLSLIEDIGIDAIEQSIAGKIEFLIEQLKEAGYLILSAEETQRRAGIVTFKLDTDDMKSVHQTLMGKNLICAYRGGGIRLSPHFYTPTAILKKALEIIRVNT